jgi:hypothetical protein
LTAMMGWAEKANSYQPPPGRDQGKTSMKLSFQ